MNVEKLNIVEQGLINLHLDASKDYSRIGHGIIKSIFRPIQPSDFENVYLPISKKQGLCLKKLIIENDCKNVVEFGASFGISRST